MSTLELARMKYGGWEQLLEDLGEYMLQPNHGYLFSMDEIT